MWCVKFSDGSVLALTQSVRVYQGQLSNNGYNLDFDVFHEPDSRYLCQ
jgi:hypothetical protein